MLSRTHEIDAAPGLPDRACSDLTAEGHAAPKPHTGAMIEVPWAAYIIAELAERVDFFSIGTIRSFTMQQARGLTDKALAIDNEDDTHRLLNRALKAAGLNGLVRDN